ncbi:hypothetical protein SAMN06297387_10534 [Streptomyces zhaozhouensis]|uniref:ABC transporter n=1 Tax=Streptomyces zhaozhouensis TaxID=1300267 RepID=A0A286DU83_9ACTN|nr:hypothetical protein [Streptomyces zhaozhouensis]SOD62219.1 hypothetical protein SAMN06297387_10534 [Streptomyces zhaozhouensis]
MKAHHRTRAAATVGALLLLTAACGNGETDNEPEPAAEETPHGYVEGAEETAETQTRLVLADAETGEGAVLDLATEETTALQAPPGVERALGDGRFAYLAGPEGQVGVVDSGGWTVDHGDHVHHYRTAPRAVGTVEAPGLAAVHADTARTVLSLDDGTVRLLDRAPLEDEGAVGEPTALETEGAAGVAVPHEGHLLVPVAAPGGEAPERIEVRDADGATVATLDESCPEAGGAAATRRGVAFACADGALLVSAEDDTFTGEKIGYPEGTEPAARATSFTHRPGSDTLAATAGEDGAWALDLAARSWTRVETGPLLAVNAVGDGATLLALTEDGELRAHDLADGRVTASTPLLERPPGEGEPAPVIEVDTARAYVNDPSAGVVHEIDHQDDLRLARTLALDFAPDVMVETGR